MKILDALRRKEKVAISVKEVKAARIVYESEDIQRVEVILTTPIGESLILELTPKQTRKLAMDLALTYQAMYPEFKIPRGYGV